MPRAENQNKNKTNMIKKAFFSIPAIVVIITAMVFGLQPVSLVLAQDNPSEQAAPPPAPSEEVSVAVKEELAVSPEAVKEVSVDLKQEFNLPANYDPIVPDGVIGKIVYPIKEVARNIQETAYGLLASDTSHAELVADHADKEFYEASKLYSENPESTDRVVGILKEYQSDLKKVEEDMPKVKEENLETAKTLSAEIAEDHIFVAPKVLSSLQENILVKDPENLPELLKLKQESLKSAGATLVEGFGNGAEVQKRLEAIAGKTQHTAFSGIFNAEILSQAKEQLSGELPPEMREAFEQAISSQFDTFEQNFKNLSATDEVKAESLGKYMAQLPGEGLDRFKIMEQFQSQTTLPPFMIEKMQEVQAKMAASIGEKIKGVVNEEIRKRFEDSIFGGIEHPGIPDLKVLNEFQDMIPQEEIRKEIGAHREDSVKKFLDRFSDDKNASEVTAEFDAVIKKIESGEILPDANFFKTLIELGERLTPDQKKFIDEMENAGKHEMVDRFQNDQNFAQRFGTFNPGDIQFFEKFRKEGFGPGFATPPGFNFEEKFKQIEQQQAQNFGNFLEFQDHPENVESIRNQFETNVPSEIKEKFEKQYNFDPGKFKEFEGMAKDKEEFFRKQFEEMQKQYQEKSGQGGQTGQQGGFPGKFPFPFPGKAGFGQGFPPSFGGQSQFGQQPGNLQCPEGQTAGQFGCELNFQKPTQRKIDERLLQGEKPSNVTCAQGLVWVSDPARLGGGMCAQEYYSCPEGQIADVIGRCEDAPKLPTTPLAPPPTPPSSTPFPDEANLCATKGGTWNGSSCQFPSSLNQPIYQTPPIAPQPGFDPAAFCTSQGGTWTGTTCTPPAGSTGTFYPQQVQGLNSRAEPRSFGIFEVIFNLVK